MVANAMKNIVELEGEVTSDAQVVLRPNKSSDMWSNSTAP